MSGYWSGMSDEAIRATNDDATSCKKSAVDKGYWSDLYLKFFCRSAERKPPEINRGYFARIASVHSLLEQFLQVHSLQVFENNESNCFMLALILCCTILNYVKNYFRHDTYYLSKT